MFDSVKYFFGLDAQAPLSFGEGLGVRLSILIFFIFTAPFLRAQSGCTDPNALNFQTDAVQNDGSCTYAPTAYFAPLKAFLPDTLKEMSGLVQTTGNRWWTLNDGGNDPVVFEINPETGTILRSIKLKDADNEDWEDIATDGLNLYVGDFGNNNGGDRQDLGIYKVPLSAIGSGVSQSVNDMEYSFIPFVYEDQTDFSNQPEDSVVFDCEAMIFFNGKLHLFSKNWKDRTTTHYVVNQTTHIAEKRETFAVQGLITSASISPDKKKVVLLGYNKSGVPNVFLWLLWDFEGDDFFGGNKRKIELGSPITYGKSEAIAFKTNQTGYVGNEFLEVSNVLIAPQAIRTFDFTPYLTQTNSPLEQNQTNFTISPNPFLQSVKVGWTGEESPEVFRVRNSLGQVVLEVKGAPETILTGNWPSGQYIFEAVCKGKVGFLRGVK